MLKWCKDSNGSFKQCIFSLMWAQLIDNMFDLFRTKSTETCTQDVLWSKISCLLSKVISAPQSRMCSYMSLFAAFWQKDNIVRNNTNGNLTSQITWNNTILSCLVQQVHQRTNPSLGHDSDISNWTLIDFESANFDIHMWKKTWQLKTFVSDESYMWND